MEANSAVADLRRTLDEVERDHILKVLASYAGNRTHAARSLDISVRTLQRKLHRWGTTAQRHI